MIPIHEALQQVLKQRSTYGTEKISLLEAKGRFLAEDIFTDRDAPPFDRVMMDGIAIQHKDLDEPPAASYKIQGIQAAGSPQLSLQEETYCLEIMTGAILPHQADTIIPYEEVEIKEGRAYIQAPKLAKRFIHYKGSDSKKGELILSKGKKITAADIGLLATVGKSTVSVAKLPKVAIISTGDELVEVDQEPQAHQIRKSNAYTLWAGLMEEGITGKLYHINDDKEALRQSLAALLEEFDVLLLSGGVSKGKFDHIPEILHELGVEKSFHRVAQRPGKPFWFGAHQSLNTKVFAYPGNPVSTYVNHFYYFQQWLYASLGKDIALSRVELAQSIPSNPALALFVSVRLDPKSGAAKALNHNGSGDLFSLAQTEGFVLLPARGTDYMPGEKVDFLALK